MEDMDIGRKISRFRKLRDWTQEELGQKMDVHKTVVSRWELGRMAPRLETLQRLAEILGIELSELADSEREEQSTNETTRFYRDMEALPEDDRQVVRKVLDAMLMKQRLQTALGAPAG
jgi:transcriptional regulator with XRE-family HTH domain